jgi:aryl-alcohol dehydrogenase-like predicted oxidoreductase
MSDAAADRRRLGRSGVHVSRFGFGGGAIGNPYAPLTDEQAYAAVDAARRQGVRCFDTVPPAVLERALRLKKAADRHDTTLRACALALCAAHPAVAGVLVCVRPAAEAEDCAEQFRAPVPAAPWAELRETGLLPSDAPVPV